jgi:hypothetical protein
MLPALIALAGGTGEPDYLQLLGQVAMLMAQHREETAELVSAGAALHMPPATAQQAVVIAHSLTS